MATLMAAVVPLTLAGLASVAGLAVLWLRARAALVNERRALATLERTSRDIQVTAHASEDLLRTVVEATPMAVVLFSDTGRIRFTNAAARELFFEGAMVEGQNFLSMIARAPEPMRRALLAHGDELFTVDGAGEGETFHLSRRNFSIADEPHTLVAVKHLTEAIARQEIATLKKVIRIISHEVNNSLGPIESLASSGRMVLKRPEHLDKLEVVFSTIEERAQHLTAFLAAYARLAKLPAPRPEAINWSQFLNGIRALWPQLRIQSVPNELAYFDPGQVEQVLINLIKNASESGGPTDAVVLEIERADGGVRCTVLDRGAGLSDEVLQSALLPFFTTKPNGTGLGLALSREIIESHRGRVRLARREGGGAAVSFWLPDRESSTALSSTHARLTLTSA